LAGGRSTSNGGAAILNERLGEHASRMTLLVIAGLAGPALKVEIDA
jgi:hypothetical protein